MNLILATAHPAFAAGVSVTPAVEYAQTVVSMSVPLPKLEASFLSQLYHRLYWVWYRYLSREGKETDWESYEETIKTLDTPQKVQAWLFANITYTKDIQLPDYWQPAERTFSRRKGDCEDYALFGMECLQDTHLTWILCMYTADSGHATLMVADGPTEMYSLGTFGLMHHLGGWENVPERFSGYKNWNYIKVLDENLDIIYEKRRGLSDNI